MRVLLVEDDTYTAKSIELILRSEGFVVNSTDLGEEGLEAGELHDYDIIILDLMLPDIDGYEVLRRRGLFLWPDSLQASASQFSQQRPTHGIA